MVVIYGTAGCAPCRQTKKKLDAKGIEYSYYDISQDSAAMDVVNSLGYSQVPVIVNGEHHWSGYRPDMLDSLV